MTLTPKNTPFSTDHTFNSPVSTKERVLIVTGDRDQSVYLRQLFRNLKDKSFEVDTLPRNQGRRFDKIIYSNKIFKYYKKKRGKDLRQEIFAVLVPLLKPEGRLFDMD